MVSIVRACFGENEKEATRCNRIVMRTVRLVKSTPAAEKRLRSVGADGTADNRRIGVKMHWSSNGEKRQIVLDVDVGIDDALMMLYLAGHPSAEIVAVGSTHGNCSAAQAAQNALRVLEVCGLPAVPVALGAESPLPNPTFSPYVHGHDGLGDTGLPEPRGKISGENAVDQLLRLSRERPGELDLIAVGAMTNLALALERDPQSLRRFRSATVLCAHSQTPGADAPELYDANVFHSPEAADRLFASGTPLTVVPIDLSYRAVLEDRHLAAIREGRTPRARFAWRILPFYCTFYQTRLGRWTASMHDPLAAGLFLDSSIVTATVERPVEVEPYADRYRAVGRAAEPGERSDRPPVRIVTAADIPRFLEGFVATLIR
jgi:purine nucleosidase